MWFKKVIDVFCLSIIQFPYLLTLKTLFLIRYCQLACPNLVPVRSCHQKILLCKGIGKNSHCPHTGLHFGRDWNHKDWHVQELWKLPFKKKSSWKCWLKNVSTDDQWGKHIRRWQCLLGIGKLCYKRHLVFDLFSVACKEHWFSHDFNANRVDPIRESTAFWSFVIIYTSVKGIWNVILMIIKFGERLLRISPRIIIGTTSFRREAHFFNSLLGFCKSNEILFFTILYVWYIIQKLKLFTCIVLFALIYLEGIWIRRRRFVNFKCNRVKRNANCRKQKRLVSTACVLL